MASHPTPATKLPSDSKDQTTTDEELYDSSSDYSATLAPSNADSPTASLYDKEDLELPITPSGPTSGHLALLQYSFFHTTSHLNIRIVPVDPGNPKPTSATDPEREATFYAVNSTFNPKASDVTLHAGPSDKGSVCGAVRMRFRFGTYHVAVGDVSGAEKDGVGGGVRWYDMQRHGAFKMRHW
jgi:hypothetical protein